MDNPFSLPDDENIYDYHIKYKKEQLHNQNLLKNTKIWDKNNITSRTSSSIIKDKSLSTSSIPTTKLTSPLVSPTTTRLTSSTTLSNKSTTKPISPQPQPSKTSLTSYMQSKRDNFLYNLSINNKKNEIVRLDNDIVDKKKRLVEVENLLELDALKFEKFLKDNDDATHTALNKQEEISRERQDRNTELKRLYVRIQKTESSINKLNDQLNDLIKYKIFINNLTPNEFLVKSEIKKENSVIAEEQPTEQDLLKLRHSHDDDDNDIFNNLEMDTLYFNSPEELLSIYSDLEERNLFLIQNVQRNEEALEDLTLKTAEMDIKLNGSIKHVSNNLNTIKSKIDTVTNLTDQILNRSVGANLIESSDYMLNNLTKMVLAVGSQLGLSSSDPSQLLTEIEKRWNNLMNEYETLDPFYRDDAEKLKESQRRQRERDLRIEQQNTKFEERLQRTKNRGNIAVQKAKAKPIMFRSNLAKKDTLDQSDDDSNDDDQKREDLLKKLFK